MTLLLGLETAAHHSTVCLSLLISKGHVLGGKVFLLVEGT